MKVIQLNWNHCQAAQELVSVETRQRWQGSQHQYYDRRFQCLGCGMGKPQKNEMDRISVEVLFCLIITLVNVRNINMAWTELGFVVELTFVRLGKFVRVCVNTSSRRSPHKPFKQGVFNAHR